VEGTEGRHQDGKGEEKKKSACPHELLYEGEAAMRSCDDLRRSTPEKKKSLTDANTFICFSSCQIFFLHSFVRENDE
jgi:hypothetical protein